MILRRGPRLLEHRRRGSARWGWNSRRAGLVLGALLEAAAGCASRASLLDDATPGDGRRHGEQGLPLDGTRRETARGDGGDGRVFLGNGASCGAGGQCLSGYCVDGVCCNLACEGPCSRCAVPGKVGICGFVVNGQPPPAGKSCPPGPQEQCQLDGACDGQGSCRRWSPGTICKAAQCEAAPSSKLQLAWTCDGKGGCSPLAAEEIDCAPYACDTAARRCFGSCTASGAACKKGVSCDGEGRCGGAGRPLSASCGKSEECAAGRCVAGVCCDADCGGGCETCVLPGAGGRCLAVPTGAAPPGGKGCQPDPLSPCGPDGTCDGLRKCRVAPAGLPCQPGSCVSSELVLRVCNGDPATPACSEKKISCDPYVCQPSTASCYAWCTSSTQCKKGQLCHQNRCVECITPADCEPGDSCVNNKCL